MVNLKYKCTKNELLQLYYMVLEPWKEITPNTKEELLEKLNLQSFLKRALNKLETHKMNPPKHKLTMSVNINEYRSLEVLFEEMWYGDHQLHPLCAVIVHDLREQAAKQLDQYIRIAKAAGEAARELTK